MAIRLQDLVKKWMRECTSVEQMAEKIVTEQLLNTMPVELQVWVGERKPATAVEAGQLADDYVQVRRTALDPSKEARKNPNERYRGTKGCYNCGQEGHIACDCRKGVKSSGTISMTAATTSVPPKTGKEGIKL